MSHRTYLLLGELLKVSDRKRVLYLLKEILTEFQEEISKLENQP